MRIPDVSDDSLMPPMERVYKTCTGSKYLGFALIDMMINVFESITEMPEWRVSTGMGGG